MTNAEWQTICATKAEFGTLYYKIHVYINSVQSLSHVPLFATPWTVARQAFLSITNSWSPPKPMSYVCIYMCVYIMYIYIYMNTLIFFEEKILIHL